MYSFRTLHADVPTLPHHSPLITHRTSPKNLFVCDFVYSFLWRVFDFFIIL